MSYLELFLLSKSSVLTQFCSKVISQFPEVSLLRDSMAKEHPEVLSGDTLESVVSQGHSTMRVSSR